MIGDVGHRYSVRFPLNRLIGGDLAEQFGQHVGIADVLMRHQRRAGL
ncbi:hypothetical protein JJQ59_23225 [Cupriavidus necator]|nr:hypothetical protein [Cupriavidus necator]QQX88299.1 hypothetical protein JJQ59_23225 [Cupriavidus necator]